MYYMQFCLKVLDIMKEAEPPTLSEEEFKQFLEHCKELFEEKLAQM